MGMGNPSSPCEGDDVTSDPCEDDGDSPYAMVDVVDIKSL